VVGKTTVSVVVADEWARALLGEVDGIAGITVLASAGNGRDTVSETVRHRPDVLVVDHRVAGATVIDQVRRAAPGTAVLAFTHAEDDVWVFSAMRAGARGYLVKRAGRDDLVRAIRGVAAGEAVFGPPIAARLRELLGSPVGPPFPSLTGRELEVLDLLAAGLPASAIAQRLRVASKTVGNHLSTILGKLRVSSRAAAVRAARDAGLGVGHASW
jgi:DNA-binding NarL/FixJ family response regulator